MLTAAWCSPPTGSSGCTTDTGTEFLLPKDVVFDGGERSLMRQTESLIRRYLRLADEPTAAKIRIDVFWIASQYAGTPSPVHFHSGDVSGVLSISRCRN